MGPGLDHCLVQPSSRAIGKDRQSSRIESNQVESASACRSRLGASGVASRNNPWSPFQSAERREGGRLHRSSVKEAFPLHISGSFFFFFFLLCFFCFFGFLYFSFPLFFFFFWFLFFLISRQAPKGMGRRRLGAEKRTKAAKPGGCLKPPDRATPSGRKKHKSFRRPRHAISHRLLLPDSTDYLDGSTQIGLAPASDASVLERGRGMDFWGSMDESIMSCSRHRSIDPPCRTVSSSTTWALHGGQEGSMGMESI
jgi:hypothetical protein